MKRKLYFECTDCWVWAEAPKGLKINREFAICPNCNKGMYAIHRTEEEVKEDSLWKDSNKVQIVKTIPAPNP